MSLFLKINSILLIGLVLSACGSGSNTVGNSPAAGSFDASGEFKEAQTVTVTPAVTDADGLTNTSYVYTWYNDDSVIEGNTSNSITFTTDQIDQAIRFEVSFNDDRGHTETFSSEANTVVIMDNRTATAEFEFSGEFEEQQTVTVTPDITDADGIVNITAVYQWYADDVLIEDVTGNEISFVPSDNGKEVYFTISFDDDRDHAESISSETFVIANKIELLVFTADADYAKFNVSRSSDSGDSWSVVETIGPVEVEGHFDTFIDTYYIDAATDNRGNILVVMSGDGYDPFGDEYDVVYSHSTDNGETFSPLNLINASDTATGDTDNLRDQKPRIATDSKGYWVATWYSAEDTISSELTGLGTDEDVVYAVSTDNGATFSSPKTVADFASTDTDNNNGSDNYPDIAMAENIWTIVWSSNYDLDEDNSTDSDILYSYSEDKGATWSPPAFLNSYATTDSGTDRSTLTSMNSSGLAVTIWAGYGESSDNLDIYASVSQDFGKTWGAATLINQYADTSSGDDFPSHIEVTEDNIAIISWEGKNPLNGADYDVYFSVSKDLGASWSTEVAMNPDANSDTDQNRSLSITQTPDGKWIASYINDDTSDTYIRKSDDLEIWDDPVMYNDDVYDNSVLVFH